MEYGIVYLLTYPVISFQKRNKGICRILFVKRKV